MKEIIVFITDLYGTFFANENMYIRDLETRKLILHLEKLRILQHADSVFFEFITLESKEVLKFFLLMMIQFYIPDLPVMK